MWINPNHPDPPRRPEPPQENGQRLVTFPRGQGVEMRVNLASFEGNQFISLRLWERDKGGAWWPVKGKGCSVRIGEAAGLIEALQSVEQGTARQHAEPEPAEARPQFIDKGRPTRPDWRESGLTAPTARPGAEGKPDEEFNEFDGQQ